MTHLPPKRMLFVVYVAAQVLAHAPRASPQERLLNRIAAKANHQERRQATTNSIGMRLVLVPAGEFEMGNHDSNGKLSRMFPAIEERRIAELIDETPVHKVRITRPFYLGAHEVPIAQFRKFADEAGYRTDAERDGTGGWGYNRAKNDFEGRKREYSWRHPGFPQQDDHPVVDVTWNDAVAFCDWLTKKEGHKYRLPTEAEWEYACRAGSHNAYSSGDRLVELGRTANLYDERTAAQFPQWKEHAVAADDGHVFTAPVGTLRPNALGLYDMHGNVWEWCSDWYGEDYYARSPIEDPQGPRTGKVKVRRGGSWQTWAFYCRSSFRNWNTPDTRYVLVGFRVAREATVNP